jgi:hypothetical protein
MDDSGEQRRLVFEGQAERALGNPDVLRDGLMLVAPKP